MFRSIVLSMVCLFALASVAEAGGGNSKSNGKIRFTNTTTNQIGLAVVDPSDSLRQATTAAQFTSRGGKILNPGESVEFSNLRQGPHQVGTALVPLGTTTVNVSAFQLRNVNVTSGRTTQINLSPMNP